MTPFRSVHLNLDGAWPESVPGLATRVDCRSWGPVLRYCAPAANIEAFHEFVRPHVAPFTLFGSGDFHHLSALWLRQIDEPFTLLSFDNHPDWDTRPPHWCCGTWINRALELPHLREAAIWGCGNFELNWPGYLYVSRRALGANRLMVYPWQERLAESGRKRWRTVNRHDWRFRFESLVKRLLDQAVYVTVDLDCLAEGESATDWEPGLFTIADIVWALGEIHNHARVIGGDVCGASSPATYARLPQRFLAQRDHPKKLPVSMEQAQERNLRAFSAIWPALTRCDQRHSERDQDHAQP